jgi:site-specific recombinase XerD
MTYLSYVPRKVGKLFQTMLRKGVSLQTIGGLLRHRSLDTTVLYAKVDVEMLSEIAEPWPGEVASC